MAAYRSIDEAQRAFDTYARTEPRLSRLWELCQCAAPPEPVVDDDDDDSAQADSTADWCAEDFFRDHVKSDLLLLAGLYRPGPPHALHSHEAFEDLYDILLNWALLRICACCASVAHDEASAALHG